MVTDIGEIKRAEDELRHWRTYLQLLSAQLLSAQERERERVPGSSTTASARPCRR